MTDVQDGVNELYRAYRYNGDDDMNARLRIKDDIAELAPGRFTYEQVDQMLEIAQAHAADPDDAEDLFGDPEVVLEMRKALCDHDWQEQPGEPPYDVCSRCGLRRE